PMPNAPAEPPRRRRRRRPAKTAEPSAPAASKPRVERAAPREPRARRALILGSGLLLFGLAMVGVDTTDTGAALTLLGLVILIFGIHTFGRLGPDEPALPGAAGP